MKNIKLKNVVKKEAMDDVDTLFEKKYTFFQNVIQKTSEHVQKSKFLDIIGISEVHKCVNSLKTINDDLKAIYAERDKYDSEMLLQSLQIINNELSLILKSFGTEHVEDLLIVCMGTNGIMNGNMDPRFVLLKKYFHPTGYLVTTNKPTTKTMQCVDVVGVNAKFHLRVYGINVFLYDETNKKTLQITGIVDDVVVDFITDRYVSGLRAKILENAPHTEDFKSPAFDSFVQSLLLKDYLINTDKDMYAKFMGYVNEMKIMKQKDMSMIVKKFVDEDTYTKRIMLIILLVSGHIYENQYLSYLLYDTLTNDNESTIDTQEQTIIFDSLPWSIKESFRSAMTITAEYTTRLSKFDMNKIPLEQQICLMKAGDGVKEKAMAKLKELKNKSEDSGGKPRQYLDGLLKIPFGVYRREDILKIMTDIKQEFFEIRNADSDSVVDVVAQTECTSAYVINYIYSYAANVDGMTRSKLSDIAKYINRYIKTSGIPGEKKIKYVNMTKAQLLGHIKTFTGENAGFVLPMYKSIHDKFDTIRDYMKNVKHVLDESVYGHDKAKKQIFRIIGQWINGEQTGYCFGFEGPPGIGKTSMAKNGLSQCLKDQDGNSRPFSMIQMGGDCQGSTLSGHNYTYVGSSWGSIVQILMDKKCMNPIIFIDELDKVSKTEHGKEIIGIMTHMLDPTQNDCFQDKYFSGVDIDLSRVLFILSYNDASLIDKILLDRVHRVSFKTLTLDEKIVIAKKYLLPEVYKKMGLVGVVEMGDEVIKYIIEQYTSEPGVRKLKEMFFDIVGEINLEILSSESIIEIPYLVTKDNVSKYVKEKHDITHRQVYSTSRVGSINGMYATSLGTGGIMPITSNFYPTSQFFELKLTGLQQEVMKESMHLALTIAWNRTSTEMQKKIRKKYEKDNCSGINIHAGDLDVRKEGPSASIAICCSIYSLLNDIPIKQYFGVTGELSLTGDAMAIGGLEHKILGSIKSGATSFIYPKENARDFTDFIEKYKDKEELKDAKFFEVSTIDEVFSLIFDA